MLASGPSNQESPVMVADGTGGVFVYWTDDGAPAGMQVMAQHVNAAGVALWTAGGINVPLAAKSTDNVTLPISDQQGGSIQIMTPYGGVATAQRLDGSGTGLWGPSGVNVFTAVPAVNGAFVYSIPAGGTSPSTDPAGVIAAWDEQVSSTGSDDIYAQRLDSSGAPMWGTLASPTVVCSAGGQQGGPAICTDGPSGFPPTHGAWIAWSDARAIAYQVYINRVSNSGAASWVNGLQVLSTPTMSAGPYLDYYGSNSALVTWVDTRDAEGDIYAQRVSPTGTMVWPADGVRIVQAPLSRSGIIMIPSGSGGEIMAWFDSRNDQSDVYAEKIDANGNDLWDPAGLAVCVQPNRQFVLGLVPDGSGGVYVLWVDKRNGTTWSIYGQHLDTAGNALWDANGKLLVALQTTTGLIQMNAISDGVGAFYLSWHDRIGGTIQYDAYISRFDSSGNTYVFVAGVAPLASAFRLALESPNPARGAARFSLALAEGGTVSVDLMDVQGRRVRTLAAPQYFAPGAHDLAWDGLDEQGRTADSGVYFAVARQAGHQSVARLVETH